MDGVSLAQSTNCIENPLYDSKSVRADIQELVELHEVR